MNNQQIIDFYLSGKSLAATSRFSGLSTYKLHQLFEKNNITIRTRHEQNILENMRRAKSINHNFFNTLNNENTITSSTSNDTTRELKRSGNIGVTTTQQMLQQERELWDWNYYNTVFKDIDNLLTLMIYE